MGYRLDVLVLQKVGGDAADGLSNVALVGFDVDFRGLWGFVRSRDTGEV